MRLQEVIEIKVPATLCYRQWLQFEELPSFLKHVKSVVQRENNIWHWTVEGPFGHPVGWDAKIDGNEPARLISWHSLSNSDIGIQGAVLFEELDARTTRMVVTVQYQAPAGPLGDVTAEIFKNPQQMIQDDLQNFKKYIEKKFLSKMQEAHYF
jgi:uncharacterized membrane protein